MIWAVLPNWKLFRPALTDFTVLFNDLMIFLSASVKVLKFLILEIDSLLTCIITNLEAFQILLQNFFPIIILSSVNLTSCPPVNCQLMPNLVASAPYFSIRLIGSIPVPKDFDILLPSLVNTVGWI